MENPLHVVTIYLHLIEILMNHFRKTGLSLLRCHSSQMQENMVAMQVHFIQFLVSMTTWLI